MADFKAPLRDIEFAMFEVLHFEGHYAEYCPSLDRDLTQALLVESARFSEHVLAPLSAIGDSEGCRLEHGQVITPTGFKAAYQQYCDAGWPSLARSVEFGGQGQLCVDYVPRFIPRRHAHH
jgi:alkylation response protein AidB-like acyl-CoA dehydrogenase